MTKIGKLVSWLGVVLLAVSIASIVENLVTDEYGDRVGERESVTSRILGYDRVELYPSCLENWGSGTTIVFRKGGARVKAPESWEATLAEWVGNGIEFGFALVVFISGLVIYARSLPKPPSEHRDWSPVQGVPQEDHWSAGMFG
jgi:hypothetical protein